MKLSRLTKQSATKKHGTYLKQVFKFEKSQRNTTNKKSLNLSTFCSGIRTRTVQNHYNWSPNDNVHYFTTSTYLFENV